ncbi:MAG: hypothetical protein WAN65_09465 [Candidatus Sulfotelmatobacter sp.]
MPKRDLVHQEIDALYREGANLAMAFQKKKDKQFRYDYQSWYTKALRVVASLAPDRLAEFRGYYEIDPKRKLLSYGTYVIQDYIKNVAPSGYQYQNFDSRGQALICFFNQITIFKSILARVDSTLGDIEGELYAELQDSEVIVARQLAKVSLRAAGALVGVLIEGHLQKVAVAHGVRIAKKNPTIADLNEPLKSASVVDTPTWRKISYLADLRNLCSHKKDVDPTKEQVEELIEGSEWLTKNVF